jgi:hypothetical protein
MRGYCIKYLVVQVLNFRVTITWYCAILLVLSATLPFFVDAMQRSSSGAANPRGGTPSLAIEYRRSEGGEGTRAAKITRSCSHKG